MSIGINIINDSGSVMIDEKYANFYLRQKGSAALSQNHISNQNDQPVGGMVDITVTANTPLFAIRAADYACVLSTTRNNDGTWTFRVISAATSGTVYWYLFDVPTNAADSAYGLQVFNEQGGKVFDSGHGYARITDEVSKDDGTAGFSAMTKNYTAGRTYAIVQASVALIAGIEWWSQGTIIHWAYYGARGGNGSVEFGGFESFRWMLFQSPEGFSNFYQTYYRAQVLDVTNF